MEKEVVRQAIKATAKNAGLIEKEVISEIETAVSDAIERSFREGNADAIQFWQGLLNEEKTLSAEDVICGICKYYRLS